MQEIRLHGRGGQGLVKASHIVVRTAVETGHYGQFIPFFGVERKGSPVFGFLRLAEEPIRRKTQVYTPDGWVNLSLNYIQGFNSNKNTVYLTLTPAQSLDEYGGRAMMVSKIESFSAEL